MPTPPPKPFELEETGETWTGTIICLAIVYIVIPILAIAGFVVWLVLS